MQMFNHYHVVSARSTVKYTIQIALFSLPNCHFPCNTPDRMGKKSLMLIFLLLSSLCLTHRFGLCRNASANVSFAYRKTVLHCTIFSWCCHLCCLFDLLNVCDFVVVVVAFRLIICCWMLFLKMISSLVYVFVCICVSGAFKLRNWLRTGKSPVSLHWLKLFVCF